MRSIVLLALLLAAPLSLSAQNLEKLHVEEFTHVCTPEALRADNPDAVSITDIDPVLQVPRLSTRHYAQPAEALHHNEPGTSQEGTKISQKLSTRHLFLTARSLSKSGNAEKDDLSVKPNGKPQGFRWGPALKQSLMFLGVQHGFAIATQAKTRRALKGPFLKDYFESAASLHGWDDGGKFFTNYIAHPMQGSFTGLIQVQNDPRGIKQRFGKSQSYWKSRLKAMAWAAASSTQFELGPIGQAAIGNVGKYRKLTYVDLVVTPTLGTVWLIGEDAVDRYIVRWVERKTNNFYLKIASRMLLNPTRSCANVLRFKKPWHRDF